MSNKTLPQLFSHYPAFIVGVFIVLLSYFSWLIYGLNNQIDSFENSKSTLEREAIKLSGEIQEKDKKLSEQQGRIDELEGNVSDKDREITDKSTKLKEKDKNLADKSAELSAAQRQRDLLFKIGDLDHKILLSNEKTRDAIADLWGAILIDDNSKFESSLALIDRENKESGELIRQRSSLVSEWNTKYGAR